MKILLIEDEQPAADKLAAMLEQLPLPTSLVATLHSVGEAVSWLRSNPHPDLLLMDIELSDGQSFRIFEEVKIDAPVIFCTAYDEYWQEAFEHNSIDYLLKPLRPEKLELALLKYENLRQHFAGNYEQLQQWRKQPEGFKKRWLIKRGADFISLKTSDIAWCYAAHKIACLVDQAGQRYLLDKSLADLEKELDPAQFYRVNRKYITSINAIKKLKSMGKGRIMVELQPEPPEEVLVSSDQAAAFKDWMDA